MQKQSIYTLKCTYFIERDLLMTEGDRYATNKKFLSAFLVSQAEDEGIDLHHVGWFQVLLQFTLLHPEQSRVWIVGWTSVCQDGFEEEHLSSD